MPASKCGTYALALTCILGAVGCGEEKQSADPPGKSKSPSPTAATSEPAGAPAVAVTRRQIIDVMKKLAIAEETHEFEEGRYLPFRGPVPVALKPAEVKVPSGVMVGVALVPGAYCVVAVRKDNGGGLVFTPEGGFLKKVSSVPKPCRDLANLLLAGASIAPS